MSTSPPSHRSRRVTALGAALVLAIAGAGCGGSDSLSTGTDTTFTDTTFTDTTSTDTTPVSTFPRTYEEAMDRLDRGEPSGIRGTVFQVPTTQIYCSIGDAPDIAGCELGDHRLPPPPGECDFPDGPKDVGRFEFTEDGEARAICNSDTIRTGDDAPTADSNATFSSPRGTRACVVLEEPGVTCVDLDSHSGFTVTEDRYTVFR